MCVAARDREGVPTVLKLYPLAVRDSFVGGKAGRRYKSRKRGCFREGERDWRLDGGVVEPFPTLYWLTCPKLRRFVSEVENSGHGYEEKLRGVEDGVERMERANESYAEERWSLLTEEDREEILRRGWGDSLGRRRGVAGIRKFDKIKCLHAHVAHYLAGGETNLVGRWVMEAVKDRMAVTRNFVTFLDD